MAFKSYSPNRQTDTQIHRHTHRQYEKITFPHKRAVIGKRTLTFNVSINVLSKERSKVPLCCDVYVHVTRSQLELKRARCKISNKGYLSLNIFVILCHNMVIRSWDITTIPKGLSETFFGRF